MVAILLVLVLILIWRNGCCIKKTITGVLCPHCATCECKKCPVCDKKQTCEKCPVKEEAKECKCSPCKKYKCELKEAFSQAERYRLVEGLDHVKVEKVPAGKVKKPKVEVKKPPVAKAVPAEVADKIKPEVKVKVPPCPACNCPACPKPRYGAPPYTYYPIYQPLPYGVRY